MSLVILHDPLFNDRGGSQQISSQNECVAMNGKNQVAGGFLAKKPNCFAYTLLAIALLTCSTVGHTAPVPSRVADIWSGSGNSLPNYLTVFNNKLYFNANDGTNGNELWVYDGSTAPSRVADIQSGSGHSYPSYLTIFNNKLYFQADDGTSGKELWVYDGSTAPSRIADIQSGSGGSYSDNFTVFNNKLYFQANDGTSGYELWVYDGSTAPSLVADIWSGNSYSDPTDLTVFNNKLYFSADDGTSGNELWVYDGSTAPSLAADIQSGSGDSFPSDLTVFNNKLYFQANDGTSGYELWVYDGSTAPSLVADIWSGIDGSFPLYFTVFNNKLYFQAEDGTSGYELWVYDGSTAPSRVADIQSGSGSSFPDHLTVFNNKLYFTANDGTSGLELWVYDGSTAPSQVADIRSGSLGSDPIDLTVFNNTLYLSATDGTSGYELWMLVENYNLTLAMSGTGTVSSSGTPAGTSCGTDCLTYLSTTAVTLTATPGTGFAFAGWNCTPAFTSGGMLTADTTCTATFNADNTGGSTSNTGGNTPVYVPPPPSETDVIVSFGGNGQGKVTSNPTGLNCQSPTGCSHTFKTDTTIQLTPIAIGQSRFQNWGNSCNNGIISASGKTVYCTVYFIDLTVPKYTLSVTKTGTGEGAVTSTPAGIDCGTACQGEFESTSEIELIAVPGAGSQFSGWTGDCAGDSSHTHAKMSQNKTCGAQFERVATEVNHFPLTVTKTGDGNGRVTSQDGQIDCGETCTANYDPNSSVTLTAVADPDALFEHWEGDCASGENSVTLTLDAAKSCVVFFDFKEPLPTLPSVLNEKLSIEKQGDGQGQVTSEPTGILLHFDDTTGAEASADFPLGTEVRLIAETRPGTTFVGFTGADPDCADGRVTMDTSKHCSAHLEIESFPAPIVEPAEPIVPQPTIIPEPVLPPVVSDETRPPKDTLSYYYNAGGQTIGDLNIVENPESTSGVGFLSNAVITGTVQLTAGTWISNIRVTKTGIVIGGTVTGLNTNEGYMGDFEFRGEFIKGGTLGGKILNLSKIFSWFEDVTLAANAHLIGGALKGKIKGDPKKPALLENLRILSGSEVSGVIIGNGVKIDKDVKIEESTVNDTPVDDAKLPALDEQFFAGIGVNASSYQTKNVAQILSGNVSIRGKMRVKQKHIGQKAKIFVTVAYRASEDSAEEFLFTINQLNGLLPWNGETSSLGENPFREEILQTTHSVKIYDGILLAPGVVKIQFGYLLEDGTVVKSPQEIELTTVE